jgi:hypothetical protein
MKSSMDNCLMMNYLSRKTIKYRTKKHTYLSQSTEKFFEKIEPNKEKIEAILENFNRFLADMMFQQFKFIDDKRIEEIILSYAYHIPADSL